uniref:Uncharacterized protein n=1 Tax=Triticum urartu TaxID=4572 RepID=A0A8R7P7N9_TRIUA
MVYLHSSPKVSLTTGMCRSRIVPVDLFRTLYLYLQTPKGAPVCHPDR